MARIDRSISVSTWPVVHASKVQGIQVQGIQVQVQCNQVQGKQVQEDCISTYTFFFFLKNKGKRAAERSTHPQPLDWAHLQPLRGRCAPAMAAVGVNAYGHFNIPDGTTTIASREPLEEDEDEDLDTDDEERECSQRMLFVTMLSAARATRPPPVRSTRRAAAIRVADEHRLPALPEELWVVIFGLLKHDTPSAF
eukprot:gene912-13525_t